MAPFWAVVQLQPQREAFALSMLARAEFTVYAPRLREWRSVRGKSQRPRELALFPGYAFLLVRLQWHAARWCPGVIRLVMDGLHPAKVPDAVIDEIRMREHNGAIEIPRRHLKAGDRVKILSGPFNGQLAIYAGMSGFERVEVLLQILGGMARVTLASEQVGALS
jgi:transcriptional antiterminator RfaH